MKGQLENKVALITGGSRGIGYAIADAYLQEGASLIICGRDQTRLTEAVSNLRKKGEVLSISCDVSRFESVVRMVEEGITRFGRIDLLVNNAAIAMTYGRVGDIEPSHWSEVIGVNLIGTFHCCHVVLPHMLKQGAGQIINLKGYGANFPSPRVTAYGASKAGISAFTKSLAREYKGTGISVNLLSPGIVRTGLLLKQDATAEAASYLKKINPVIDLIAGSVEPAAALAVKMASKGMEGVTGKEFRVLSRTKMAIRFAMIGMAYFFKKLKRKSISKSII